MNIKPYFREERNKQIKSDIDVVYSTIFNSDSGVTISFLQRHSGMAIPDRVDNYISCLLRRGVIDFYCDKITGVIVYKISDPREIVKRRLNGVK